MRLVLDLQACQTPESRQRGIGRYSLSLAEAIARAAGSHELWVALSLAFPDSLDELESRFAPHVPAERFARFSVSPPVFGIDPANGWRAAAAARLRESFLARLAPDLVHVSSLFEGLVDDAVVSVGALETMPTAVTLYDLIPYLHADKYLTSPPVEAWYRARIEDLKRADLLLAISEHTRQEAIDALGLPPDRVVNVSADADPRFRRIDLTPGERRRVLTAHGLTRPFVMYTGGVDYRKNLEGMIEAYARLDQALRARHQLAIVCRMSDDERRRLLAVGEKAGLSAADLVFPGFVSDDDLVALYNLCRLFVFPSLHEGFGLPPLEAMRCGAPVIGSNRSSVPEVIGLADALFDPLSSEAIAQSLHRGLTDDAFRERLVRNADERRTRFSWQESGRRALEAFEEVHAVRSAKGTPPATTPRRLPRLAYVSPLPPERTGIADFSAELLPALAAYYEIELVTDQRTTTDAWIRESLPMVPVAEFAAGRDRYDRVLYHMGNSIHHARVPDLLARVPGVLVLHDVYLSHLMRDVAAAGPGPRSFPQILLEAHGYAALEFLRTHGEERAVWEYPCSLEVIAGATGVIVQSRHACDLIAHWYGPSFRERTREIPHLREPVDGADRAAARAALGVPPGDFLVCCFGVVGPAKLNREVFDAWSRSVLAERSDGRLVFVGHVDPSPYGSALGELVQRGAGRSTVSITGYVDAETYRRYLAAADLAVQLRTNSRGETSGAILDCMAHGVPVLANRHGAAAELPDDVVRKIAEDAPQDELAGALRELFEDAPRRRMLASKARAYLAAERRPESVARRYRDAVEGFADSSPFLGQRRLVRSIGGLPGAATASAADLAAVARCITENRDDPAQRQLLVDISTLVQTHAKTGIQRVVRNTLLRLLRRPFDGLRVQPVYRRGAVYRLAQDFVAGLLAVDGAPFGDPPVDVRRGDVFLGLDLDAGIDAAGRAWLRHAAHRGMRTCFVLYDLLPVSHPQHFLPEFAALFSGWLEGIVQTASGIACISESVADQLAGHLEGRPAAPAIGFFHLGADLEAGGAGDEIPAEERGVLDALGDRPFFLMVGTLEPRKAHALVLAAVERIWARGADAGLVVVGREGWLVQDVCSALRAHPEAGRRLFWLDHAGDGMLQELYGRAAALIQASEAEGFGLPLVEAAQHGVSIIARDLRIFREVAGDHAFYFGESEPDGLAGRLEEWLVRRDRGDIPTTDGMKWLTWAESADQLLDVVLNERWKHARRFARPAV